MKNRIKLYVVFVFYVWVLPVKGQTISPDTLTPVLDYRTFLKEVAARNMAYAAEQYNIQLAEANLLSAGIFPDPEVEVGLFDNAQRRMKMGYGVSSGISWTMELGGKRRARVDVAQNEVELTKLMVEDFFRHLRADATLAYLRAIHSGLVLHVQEDSYQQLLRLAQADSVRLRLGSITQVDARQSKLEARTMRNEVFAAEADQQAAYAHLLLLLGREEQESLPLLEGDLQVGARTFMLPTLVLEAQDNRADLKAALGSKHISHKMLQLAKANRVIDLGVSVGMEYNAEARNEMAPSPSFTAVQAGVSIPLKFSNRRPGELRAAQYGILQAEKKYELVELTIKTEVRQAFYTYQAAAKQVEQFNAGLLEDAKAILDGKVYSYQRGETSLLEVLDAQRTYNGVQQSFYQALYDYAAALVELERATGIWDIDL
ncbi:outer membrane protein, cobalt-zinc-cadmium efflux system [Sphingobacterium psychroaquaticum]|uniref:Outer membrane protein, cobalt-zinc-cadmium efflux system n=2 Tax=Sphingobacterium psychroaquaticum TaxID=561061 RepID=A0A1X7I1K8_9SPHI|nr:outer membrane protein, cobalt-zinc-cadmium efflux system [Sphingobacterium psychroaquaticum]